MKLIGDRTITMTGLPRSSSGSGVLPPALLALWAFCVVPYGVEGGWLQGRKRERSFRTGERVRLAVRHGRFFARNDTAGSDMDPDVVNGRYSNAKEMLRNRTDDYVVTDTDMHLTGANLTLNSSNLNVTIEADMKSLADSIGQTEDEYKTAEEDLFWEANRNHTGTLLTATTPPPGLAFEKVNQLENDLEDLKHQADGLLHTWNNLWSVSAG